MKQITFGRTNAKVSTISFNSNSIENFELSVYDVLGNKITTIKDGELPSGYHNYQIDLGDH